jgi:Na+/H+ antiporter NhaC
MKKIIFISFFLVLSLYTMAQCSVCTKTSMQMGERPAEGMNTGIVYLMLMPFAIVGFLFYKWWKNNQEASEESN